MCGVVERKAGGLAEARHIYGAQNIHRALYIGVYMSHRINHLQ